MEVIADGQLVLDSVDGIAARLAGRTDELVLCGHTHIAREVRIPRAGDDMEQLLVNPGSVGLQAYDDDQPSPYTVQNGSPEARYAIVERGTDGWNAIQLTVPYDREAMARLAESNGRPEWAVALRTGRVMVP